MTTKRSVDDDGSSDESSRKRPTPSAKASSLPKQKATVKELATDPVTVGIGSPAKSLIEPQIIQRIRKCFAMATSSAGTTEAEANRVLRMVYKLMSQYNVTQGEAFERNDETDHSQHGGKSVVAVTSTKNSRNVVQQGFTNDLADAMCIFFDCESYSCRFQTSVQWTFYGVSSNTAAAAMAFEMTYNLILDWAALRDISVRTSYCLGLAKGLHIIACRERKEEEMKARDEESKFLSKTSKSGQSPHQNSIACQHLRKNACEVGESTFCTSGYNCNTESEFQPDFIEAEDLLDPFADFDKELQKVYKEEKSHPASTWASEKQLKLFRASADNIATAYIHAQGIKISGHWRKAPDPSNHLAYEQGKVDSRKINVRSVGRNRLE